MASRDIAGYFRDQQKKCQAYPDLCQEWSSLEELYNKKLWHQLTLKILNFTKHSYFSENENLIQFYQNFVIDFEHRINPLALMEIVIGVAKQMKDFQEAIKFLEKIKENIKSSDEALVLCLTAIGSIYLQLNNLEETKKIIKETDKRVNDLDGVTPVHRRFYELSSNYYKIIVDYASYYRDSLRYLGCVDIKDIPANELLERAFNLCLAAILGKNVYNFGELLAHPVLNSIQNTSQQWLVDLLYAFNSGNLNKFYELEPHWKQQKDLQANVSSMLQKISLLCLMEMTFKRPANHRQLTFEEISEETKKPIDEVELLVMKALSLKLVEGLIDGVEQRVHMSWVQPRVLDKQQILDMIQNCDKSVVMVQEFYQEVILVGMQHKDFTVGSNAFFNQWTAEKFNTIAEHCVKNPLDEDRNVSIVGKHLMRDDVKTELNGGAITGLRDRMKIWFHDVDEMQTLVEDRAQDILT